MRIATASVRTGFAMTHYWKYGINPAGGQRRPPLQRVQEVRGERNPPVTVLPCQPPLGKGAWGRGTRIATASVRTGFAMTWFLQGVRYGIDGRTEASAPTEGLQGARKNGRGRAPPLRRAYKECGKRAAGDMQEGASLRPSFGFLDKKIPASKAGSILPYYGGGDNARKNFVGGEILSHTMIFF